MKKWAVLATLLLMGCAAAMSRPLILPDGRQGYTVDCSNPIADLPTCYKKAGELCPSGYDVVGKDNSPGNAILMFACKKGQAAK